MYAVRELSWEEVDLRNRFVEDTTSAKNEQTTSTVGGSSSKRGISNDQVAVFVTADGKGSMDLSVATMGRIGKKDIQDAIGNRISKGSILCTDGHVSYKGFAKDENQNQWSYEQT
jgi:hypothetical protein